MKCVKNIFDLDLFWGNQANPPKNKNKPQESNQQEPQTHPHQKSLADLQGGSQNVLIPRSVWNVVNIAQELGFFAALPHLVVESVK